jgi:hypothetical protein
MRIFKSTKSNQQDITVFPASPAGTTLCLTAGGAQRNPWNSDPDLTVSPTCQCRSAVSIDSPKNSSEFSSPDTSAPKILRNFLSPTLQRQKFSGIFFPGHLRTKNSMEFSSPDISGRKILWNFTPRTPQDEKFFGIFFPGHSGAKNSVEFRIAGFIFPCLQPHFFYHN